MSSDTTDIRRGRRELSSTAAFWTIGAVLGLFFLAAAAPSPLYALYQQQWRFSPLTLTAVFAVYALALLIALLTTGSLSDAIGRRPVLLTSVAVEIVAMAVFASADGVGWLYAARAVQGFATGLATGALSAALLDLQPPGRPLASVVTTGGPTSGQAVGALAAGALVQYGPAPSRLVFVLLLAGFAAGAVALWFTPEPVERRPMRVGMLRPRVGVPLAARPAFLAATPCLVAVWALSGLHLSLGPSLAALLTGSSNRLVTALVVTLLTGCGAISAVSLRGRRPSDVLVASCVLLIVGMGGTLLAVLETSVALLFVSTAVAGFGFGAGLLGSVATITGSAPPTERGRVSAAMFAVSYLAFSLPALAAGAAVSAVGLGPVVIVYGACLAVLALAALAATLLLRRGARAAATSGGPGSSGTEASVSSARGAPAVPEPAGMRDGHRVAVAAENGRRDVRPRPPGIHLRSVTGPQGLHPVSGEGLAEADAVAGGLADVGVVQPPTVSGSQRGAGLEAHHIAHATGQALIDAVPGLTAAHVTPGRPPLSPRDPARCNLGR